MVIGVLGPAGGQQIQIERVGLGLGGRGIVSAGQDEGGEDTFR